MRALIRSLAPTCFDDVAALVALYRPGPMAANMHNDFADRKNGRKPVTCLHPDLAEELADTHGLMIYQESMMRVATRFAGYSLLEADNLRKACLPAGTLMLTKARGYVPIERVMSLREPRLQTIDTVSCTSRFEPSTTCGPSAPSRSTELTTSTGYAIRATAEHPLLVEDEWRELGQISPGDLVGVAAHTMTHGGGKASMAEVELAALLISEGYTPDVRLQHANAFFCNTDPELISTFAGAYQRHFGRPHPGVVERQRGHTSAAQEAGAARPPARPGPVGPLRRQDDLLRASEPAPAQGRAVPRALLLRRRMGRPVGHALRVEEPGRLPWASSVCSCGAASSPTSVAGRSRRRSTGRSRWPTRVTPRRSPG